MTLHDQLGKPVLFHWVGWHGKDGPSLTGYDSRNPSVISHQLSAMQNLGGAGAGVVALTFGPTASPFIHEACMEMCNQCNALKMPFALCYDPWVVKDPATGLIVASPAKENMLIAALQNADTQFMLNSDTYLAGKPVLDFGTTANKATVLAAVPGIKLWQNGSDFDWPRFPGPTVNKTQLPCVFVEFDDGTGTDRNLSATGSGPARIIPSLAGGTFWTMAGQAITLGQYAQFVTWNDVKEGTDVEKFASILWGKI